MTSLYVPMLALGREYAEITAEVQAAWNDTLRDMRLLGGRQLRAFEQEVAAFAASPHAVGVASGTDALVLALLAVGVGAGDEVLLQANGFIAGVEAIRLAGGRPVLVDCEPRGYGPDVEQLEAAVTPRTRALLAMHLYGEPLHMMPLLDFCQRHGLRLVEDGSHAHGALRDGRHVGTFGDAGAFSCGVIKNLGAFGDAGLVLCADPRLAQSIRLRQSHGQAGKNQHVCYGFNSRLDELQAAVLRIKLRRLEARNERRRQIARRYSAALEDLGVVRPHEDPGVHAVFHQYVVQVRNRTALREALLLRGVETGIHYPTALHQQPAWIAEYGSGFTFPRAEYLASHVLSLPVVPDLTDTEVEHVVRAFRATADLHIRR